MSWTIRREEKKRIHFMAYHDVAMHLKNLWQRRRED
jgi:hypothetical protein